jgi:3-hydroxyisobutyrate dehydrogenase-like beta-hydroxyacid dehydrogenase
VTALAFVGAGQMGMPMVRRLVAAGRRVTVHARRDEARREATAAGAETTADLAAAVRDADIVMVCLYSGDQLLEVALGPSGLLATLSPGSLVVVHTTCSPAITRQLADHGAVRDVRIVEAPVSGSADDITAGGLTVLLSGDPADVEDARKVVGAYGEPVIAIGPLGSAPTIKLLNNALFAAQVQLVGEVERIATSVGVTMADAATAIQRSSGASYAMGLVERRGSVADLVAAAGHFLHKDVAAAHAAAADLGLDLGQIGQVTIHGPLHFAGRATEGAERS